MRKHARKGSGDRAKVILIIRLLVGGLFALFILSTYFSFSPDHLQQPALPVNTNNQTLRNRNQELFEEYARKHVLVKSSQAVTCGAENMQLLRGEVLPEGNKYDMILMLKDAPQYYSLCLGDDSHQHTVELTLEQGQCDILVSVSPTPKSTNCTV